MVCYHPIRALVIGEYDGKKRLKFIPWYAELKDETKMAFDEIQIPCGKCIGCRIDKSKDWANRMVLELQYHDCASFITLTYDDEHVPVSHYLDEVDGIERDSLTLRKTDFQKFMKRLRKHFNDKKIRYFACGEYGSNTLRPHYHAIIYGIDFPDKTLYKLNKDNNPCYRSEILEKLWPFGYSMINEVNWQTCAYVARYTLKKYTGRHNIYYQTLNIEPEFNLMSRRPGIGYKYFEEHTKDIYSNQEIYISTPTGGKKIKPPKYFDRLYDALDHGDMEALKAERSYYAELNKDVIMKETDLEWHEYLLNEERKFKDKISTLRRDKV